MMEESFEADDLLEKTLERLTLQPDRSLFGIFFMFLHVCMLIRFLILTQIDIGIGSKTMTGTTTLMGIQWNRLITYSVT